MDKELIPSCSLWTLTKSLNCSTARRLSHMQLAAFSEHVVSVDARFYTMGMGPWAHVPDLTTTHFTAGGQCLQVQGGATSSLQSGASSSLCHTCEMTWQPALLLQDLSLKAFHKSAWESPFTSPMISFVKSLSIGFSRHFPFPFTSSSKEATRF